MIARVIHKLFYSCEDASLHAVRRSQGKSSMVERMRLWMHLRICDICKLFDQQNQKLDSLVNDSKGAENLKASEEVKAKWKAEIQK